MAAEPVAGHQRARLAADGAERGPAGGHCGPHRRLVRSASATAPDRRWASRSGRRRASRRRNSSFCARRQSRGFRSGCAREVREFSSRPGRPTTRVPACCPTHFPQRRDDRRRAAVNPADRPQRGVNEQGLAGPHPELTQVGDEPLTTHGQAAGLIANGQARSSRVRLQPLLPGGPALGGPAAGRSRGGLRDRLVEPGLDGSAHARRRTGLRAGSARPTRPGSRSPLRSSSASGRTARPRRARPARHLVTPHPPVVGDRDVRVRALQQGTKRARVVPPGREEHRWSVRSHRSNMSVRAPSLTCWNSWMISSARSAPLGRPRGCDRAERLPGGGADLPAGHVVGQWQHRRQPGRDGRARSSGSPAR